MDEQEKPKETIPRREHLDHVVRFCLGVWAVFAIAAAFIVAKFLDEPVDFLNAFIGWLFIFTIVAIIFAILTGLVVNRLMLVAYTKPDIKEVPASWAARVGRAGHRLITIAVLVILLGSMVVAIFIPARHPPDREATIVTRLRMLPATQEQYRVRFGTYGTLEDLVSANLADEFPKETESLVYEIESEADKNSWSVTCTVVEVKRAVGVRGWHVDQTGVIRFSLDGSPPTSTSPSLDY